ncbi:MAG: hypothetical protein AAB382_11465 [Chloroflexota bacterium]
MESLLNDSRRWWTFTIVALIVAGAWAWFSRAPESAACAWRSCGGLLFWRYV